MSVKVELGFTASGASAPFFRLDDPVLGVLNGTEGLLGGGEILVEVTEFLRDFSIARGKSRELERFNAGQATIRFNNADRTFDPTFAASPFFGQVSPRRQVRITVDDVVQYEGTIDDWNIDYDRGGNSISTAQAFDGFANLANITLENFTPDTSLARGPIFILDNATQGLLDGAAGLLGGTITTGNAIDSALNSIDWPEEKRDLDTGLAILEGNPVADGRGILDFIQTAGDSEPGEVFISKNGSVKFVERNAGFAGTRPLFADDGSGIDYTALGVVFGTELLFNDITLSNSENTVVTRNNVSINLYGERDLTRVTLLNSLEQLEKLGDFLSSRFGDPEFRFELIEVDLTTLPSDQREELINLELGDVVQVRFTPNGIAPAIERFQRVIRLNSSYTPTQETFQIGLQSTQGALLVLSDPFFGKLDADNSLGF